MSSLHVLTHYNGDRPYCVKYNRQQTEFSIYKRSNPNALSDDLKTYDVLLKHYPLVKKAWIAVGDTVFGTDDRAFGNSVLLHLDKCRYVYIGAAVLEFDTPEEDIVVSYYSQIALNDVPYPVAKGKQYAYFMYHDVGLPLTALRPNVDWKNAYFDFYGHSKDKWYVEKYGQEWKNRPGFDPNRNCLMNSIVVPMENIHTLCNNNF